MSAPPDSLQRELQLANRMGGYFGSIICTDEGLLIASAGSLAPGAGDEANEAFAGFTSLFDDIVLRARRDLAIDEVDELTLLDARRGRLVIRPINRTGSTRMMLVVAMPARATWRRLTGGLVRRLEGLLGNRLDTEEG